MNEERDQELEREMRHLRTLQNSDRYHRRDPKMLAEVMSEHSDVLRTMVNGGGSEAWEIRVVFKYGGVPRNFAEMYEVELVSAWTQGVYSPLRRFWKNPHLVAEFGPGESDE